MKLPTSRLLAFLVAAVILAVLFTRLVPIIRSPFPDTDMGAGTDPDPPTAKVPPPLPSPSPVPPPVTVHPTAPELSARLNAPDGGADEDLQIIDQFLHVYRQAFGENPVGQNEDVTAALLGDNPARTAFLPPDHPALADGKLLDRWGSPWWFHPLSARVMEIRSAGPDRDLFTADDILPVTTPRSDIR